MLVYCEHCGEIDTKTPQMEKDGIEWCVWCMCAGDEISDEELQRILEECGEC